MKSVARAIGMALFASLLPALTNTAAAGRELPPNTGTFVQERYAVREGREAPESRTAERITFRGSDVRHELLQGVKDEKPVEITVEGNRYWHASTRTGRLQEAERPSRQPYTDQVQSLFLRLFAGRVAKQATWNGWSCWQYAWHEDAKVVGDIGSSAQDVTYWVLADRGFPLILRYESSLGSRMETRELRLGRPVPAALFEKPAGFLQIQPFKLPEGEFEVEVRRQRVSRQYGWKTDERDRFVGKSIGKAGGSTHFHEAVTTQSSGADSRFAPPPEVLDADKTRIEIQRLFLLSGGRVVRKEKILALPASVLELALPPEEKLTTWVVDHPLFGTITVKSVRTGPSETETTEVLRIRSGRH